MRCRAARSRSPDCDIHHLWWWHLDGPTDLDLQIPLCGAHHRRLHDGDYSITREEARLVFRDPKGRVIADTDQILNHQLDLLTSDTRATDGAHDTAGAVDDLDLPDGPYQHGTWAGPD